MAMYWKINNAEGKTWIIPTQNARVALQLYQPSGRNGKLLKALLPFFSHIVAIWSPFPVEKGPIEPGLTAFLSEFFPNKQLTFSFFLGTPSAHKKSTIQVAENDSILAYCKTSNNPAVTTLFNREQSLLDWLVKVGIKHIPVCLYNNQVNGYDQQVFVMSTEKDKNSEVIHQWSSLHDSFLKDLIDKTSTEYKFEDTDYYKIVSALKDRLNDLPDCMNRNVVDQSISAIFDNYSNKQVNAVAMHGDFTPWNMFLQKDHLFVFDWEYALKSSPLNLDRYHFYSQQAFFEKHWNAAQVMEFMATEEGKWMQREHFKMYLILIISVFVTRETGKCQSTDLFQYWNDLLTAL